MRKAGMACLLFFAVIVALPQSMAYGKEEKAEFALTEEEKAYIDSLGVLCVAVDNNFEPMSKYSGGNYTGASVELFETITEAIHLKYQYVMKEDSWATKVAGVKSDKVQILFPVSRNEGRAGFGCYSQDYYQTYYCLLALEQGHEELEALDRIRNTGIGVVQETSIIEYLCHLGYSSDLVYFDSDESLYQALKRGDVEYGCQNVSVFIEDYFTKELFYLKQVYKFLENPKEYCYFFTKKYENTPLIDIFDRAIDYYNSQALFDKYEVGQLELMNSYIARMKERNTVFFCLVAAVALVICLIKMFLDAKKKKEMYAYAAKINETAFLQAQIKPHFLYNTLSAIAALCYVDAEKAGELTVSLSRYMSIIFQSSNCSEWIPLEREIRLIELYLNIEKTRHGERLQYLLDMGLDSSGYRIRPLLIQPIVENAVKHGALQQIGGGTVKVTIWQEEEELFVAVEDDGAGMSEKELRRIDNREAKEGESALLNIRRRLAMEGGSLSIVSEENQGTRVILRIPVRKGNADA